MMKWFALVLVFCSIINLALTGCGGPPDAGHVGPIGPVGPEPIDGSTPSNATIIENTGVTKTTQHSFVDFTKVEISDGFDVNISYGATHSVITEFEETAMPYVVIYQENDTLMIMLEPDKAYHMVNITLNVDIKMPELISVVLNDGADATVKGLTGFTSEVDFLSELH
jgi:hypothetical protein